MTQRIAVAQIAMRWTTAENLGAIEAAMRLARTEGAQLCAFSELALSGFHRQIAREALPEVAGPALEAVRALAAELSLAVSVGSVRFGEAGEKYIAQLLIDEHGEIAAEVRKRGLTDPEATFFARGSSRPVGRLQGLRCSAVICREVGDHDEVAAQLPRDCADLIFVPGALRQDPDKARTDPPSYVDDIRRLARATGAHLVQTNWPNVLNRPEDNVDCGGSIVIDPQGETLLRLPLRASGVALFALGARGFEWHPQ